VAAFLGCTHEGIGAVELRVAGEDDDFHAVREGARQERRRAGVVNAKVWLCKVGKWRVGGVWSFGSGRRGEFWHDFGMFLDCRDGGRGEDAWSDGSSSAVFRNPLSP
jgi:hypothetical protein